MDFIDLEVRIKRPWYRRRHVLREVRITSLESRDTDRLFVTVEVVLGGMDIERFKAQD